MARARKSKVEEEPAPTSRRPTTKSERTRADVLMKQEGGGLRERMTRRLMSVGFLRRRYVKRMLKYMEKTQAKGKRLPAELYELNRFLAQVPKGQRAERLEQAITAQGGGGVAEQLGNRDLRRASANQQRQSGRGSGRYRPGMAPRSLQQGPRVPKKPR